MSALDRWDAKLEQRIADLKRQIHEDEVLGMAFMSSESASEETIAAVSGRLRSAGHRITYDVSSLSLDKALKWSQYVAEFSKKYPFRLNVFPPHVSSPDSFWVVTEERNFRMNLTCLTKEAKTLLLKSVMLISPYNTVNCDRSFFSRPSYYLPPPELMTAVQWILATYDRVELLTDTETHDEEAKALFSECLNSDEYQAEYERIAKEWKLPTLPEPSQRIARISWWRRLWEWTSS